MLLRRKCFSTVKSIRNISSKWIFYFCEVSCSACFKYRKIHFIFHHGKLTVVMGQIRKWSVLNVISLSFLQLQEKKLPWPADLITTPLGQDVQISCLYPESSYHPFTPVLSSYSEPLWWLVCFHESVPYSKISFFHGTMNYSVKRVFSISLLQTLPPHILILLSSLLICSFTSLLPLDQWHLYPASRPNTDVILECSVFSTPHIWPSSPVNHNFKISLKCELFFISLVTIFQDTSSTKWTNIMAS